MVHTKHFFAFKNTRQEKTKGLKTTFKGWFTQKAFFAFIKMQHAEQSTGKINKVLILLLKTVLYIMFFVFKNVICRGDE